MRQVRQRVEHRGQIGVAQLIGMLVGRPGRVGFASRRSTATRASRRRPRPARPAAAPRGARRRAHAMRGEEPRQLAFVARPAAGAGTPRRATGRRRRATSRPARRPARPSCSPCATGPEPLAQTSPPAPARSASSSRGSAANHSRTPGPASSAAPATSSAPRFLTMAVNRSALGSSAEHATPDLIRERRQQRHRRAVGRQRRRRRRHRQRPEDLGERDRQAAAWIRDDGAVQRAGEQDERKASFLVADAEPFEDRLSSRAPAAGNIREAPAPPAATDRSAARRPAARPVAPGHGGAPPGRIATARHSTPGPDRRDHGIAAGLAHGASCRPALHHSVGDLRSSCRSRI